MMKETVDKDTFITSRNSNKKNYEAYQNVWTLNKNKEVKPIQPTQKIYQRNTYRKDLTLLHHVDDPGD